MLKIRSLLLTLCFLFGLSALGTVEAQSVNNEVSFIQVANTASLVAIPGQSNQYMLTLFNVSPYITYYIKRPSRVSGLATLANFIKAWSVGNNSFAQDNPNAVIYAGQINGQTNQSETAYVVQLGNPSYNQQKNQISYMVTPLGRQGFILQSINLNNVALVIN